MATKPVYVLLKLDPEVADEIDRRSGGPVQLFVRSGRAGWIKNLIYQQIGYTPPERGRAVKRLDLPLHLVNMQLLKPVEELIVRLGQHGRTIAQIVKYLNDQKVVPPENSRKWHRIQVERLLNDVIARTLVTAQAHH